MDAIDYSTAEIDKLNQEVSIAFCCMYNTLYYLFSFESFSL